MNIKPSPRVEKCAACEGTGATPAKLTEQLNRLWGNAIGWCTYCSGRGVIKENKSNKEIKK